jgi:hypothetical protein
MRQFGARSAVVAHNARWLWRVAAKKLFFVNIKRLRDLVATIIAALPPDREDDLSAHALDGITLSSPSPSPSPDSPVPRRHPR